MKGYADNATICALSSPPGMGAIALIRMSGGKALEIAGKVFQKDLAEVKSHTAVFGVIKDNGVPLDESVAVFFRGPNSFTGEDTVEINCHGSIYIQQKV
ncbi:MAG: tRNA uridine-5-carboxymethylaminomethyl(34) synthesis GTPase MnmE, partial [Bacteroidota bacterium]